MSKKYKITQNGKFLGHFYARTPEEAVDKAITKYGQYYNIDTNDWFDIQYGFKTGRIYLGEE